MTLNRCSLSDGGITGRWNESEVIFDDHIHNVVSLFTAVRTITDIMEDPGTIEAVIGILKGMITAFMFGWFISMYRGDFQRNLDGTIDGLLEMDETYRECRVGGLLPDIIGGLAGVFAGMVTYIVLGTVSLGYVFVQVYMTGKPVDHLELLYISAGFGVIVTVFVQESIDKKIRYSSWYLGHLISAKV